MSPIIQRGEGVIGERWSWGKHAPKDKKKEAQMDKATIKALHESIAHWNDICYGMEDNFYSSKCSLCGLYHCPRCPLPIKCESSDSKWCEYYTCHNPIGDRNKAFCTVDSADAAEAMIEMLVSLLPEGERPCRYEVGIDSSFGESVGHSVAEWCLSDGRLNISGRTGITTDGRNAFPQAKEVWRKIFAKQGILFVPPGHYTVSLDGLFTIPHIPGWREMGVSNKKTIDNKCVTCGQEVKRKVTKYKVVFEGAGNCVFGPAGLHISEALYASAEEFNKSNPGYKYVSLVLETAKEFDE